MKFSQVTVVGLLLYSSPSCIFGEKDQDIERSVDNFHSVLNVLNEDDKNYLRTHSASLPSSAIHSMEQNLTRMKKNDMEDINRGEDDWIFCKRKNGCKCILDRNCDSGRCSKYLKCEDKLNNGSSCGEDDDCKTGACNWLFKCVDKGQNGGYCLEDEDCNSGRCSKYLKCADKLSEYDVCWKGGNDCKTGLQCLSPNKKGPGLCVPDKTMSCLVEAAKSVPSSIKDIIRTVSNSFPKGMPKGISRDKIASKMHEFAKENASIFDDAVKKYKDCDGADNILENKFVSLDMNGEETSIAPSLVTMISVDGPALAPLGWEIEVGQVVSFEWGVTYVIDFCVSGGNEVPDVGIEMGLGFFKEQKDVGGFTNCLTIEGYAPSGKTAGGYICGSLINDLFKLGRNNWEVGIGAGLGKPSDLSWTLGSCFSYKWYEQNPLKTTTTTALSSGMIPYGEGYCTTGYYAGWDGKGIKSQADCDAVCASESQCRHAAFYQGKTCSRYKGATCTLNSDKNHSTDKKVMIPYGSGYCTSGYYAGWDKKGINSQAECDAVCAGESQCTFAAFFKGKTCSRYKGSTCTLNSDKNHYTDKKLK
jgi:hypothetical protein